MPRALEGSSALAFLAVVIVSTCHAGVRSRFTCILIPLRDGSYHVDAA